MSARRPIAGSARRARADERVVEQGLAESRSRAQALILAGQIWLGDRRVDKPGAPMPPGAMLRLEAGPRFVSRGGDKLAHAIDSFADAGLRVADRVAVDIGASTGGFTDCLLQHGARRVYAIDVGHGQLHPKLRGDPRVVARERTNARHLAPRDFADRIELVVVDASFIGIAQLTPAIAGLLAEGGELVVLVKPQFEAGREAANRGRGVIRDPAVRDAAIARARQALAGAGFELVAETDSPVRGPKGNIERLVYARRPAPRAADADR